KELADTGDIWLKFLAVVRSEREDAATFGPVFVDAVRAVNPLYNTDRVRWYDMLRTVLGWAERRRPETERQTWRDTAKSIQPSPDQQMEVSAMGRTIGEAILEEGMAAGAVKQTRRLVLLAGEERFGKPVTHVVETINAISDLHCLEALHARINRV